MRSSRRRRNPSAICERNLLRTVMPVIWPRSRSRTMNPMLCRVRTYSFPGFPKADDEFHAYSCSTGPDDVDVRNERCEPGTICRDRFCHDERIVGTDAPFGQGWNAMSIMGMGWMEIAIIAIGALLIFGPDRLPEVAGQVGKFVRDIRKMTTELTGELERTAGVSDIKKAVQSELAGVKSTVDSATKGVSSSVSSATSSVNKSVSAASNAAKGSTTAAKTTAAKTSAAQQRQIPQLLDRTPPKPRRAGSQTGSFKEGSTWRTFHFLRRPTPVKTPLQLLRANGTSPGSNGVVKERPETSRESAGVASAANLDALGRARQRRLAAGYNKRIS